jgi:cytochrome b
MASQITNVRVWDWPIRLFHWLLVVAIIGLFVTGKVGGNWMEWHEKIGYFVLGLILFRVVWGFVGTYHARFVNFVRGPKTVFTYTKSLFKKDSPRHLGHNPMGAISVLAFLLVVGFQAVSGLFADDDIMLRGPYASMVGSDWSSLFTKLHKWNSDLILILIGVHVAAILFYVFVKKDNLVKAMFTGEKSSVDERFGAKMAEKPRKIWVFWIVATLVGVLIYLIASRFFLVG